jgi:diaminopimelate decarboxylase
LDYFSYRGGDLYCEDLRLDRFFAERTGTPVYVYSQRTLQEHFRRLEEAFHDLNPLICYSVKANSNLSLLRLFVQMGAGFDVVSGGEIFRVLRAGADPGKVVFAGVGKLDEEIRFALGRGIHLFTVESFQELKVISDIAATMASAAPVALRINPDVDPKTHRHITTGKRENKFGLDLEMARKVLKRAPHYPGVKIRGLHFHIGSQITKVEPYAAALRKVLDLADSMRSEGFPLEWINVGGGFGIHYSGGEARSAREFAEVLSPLLTRAGYRLIIEPGRFIVGNAGVLLTRVLYIKQAGPKRFVICDAGMNDLVRPALYGAYHRIWPTKSDIPPRFPVEELGAGEGGAQGGEGEVQAGGGAVPEAVCAGLSPADIVGPICESSDCFAEDRPFPEVKRGDLVAVFSAGAYGFSMSSNYNSRPRPAEALVRGNTYRIIRKREGYEDLVRGEM